MSFTECARLAEQHPDLARVFERLESQLGAMGTAVVIRPDDLASLLNVDPNQMHSTLDLLAQEELLLRIEMIECAYCEMAAPLSGYQEAIDEEEDYRCTSCDRPLTDRTIRIITAYRRGAKWPEIPKLRDGSGDVDPVQFTSSISILGLDEHGWYTHSRLAEVFNLGKEALRKRLDRYREQKPLGGWKQNDDRRPRESKYLYQLRAVKVVIEELRASSQRPAK
jgi:hypothetical protein